MNSLYLQIIENGRVTHVIDARDEKYSNWLRFVNCARNDVEQNLVAFQFRGEIYYRSYKTIEPDMELLVWYGDRYACDLDILNKDESDKMTGMCSSVDGVIDFDFYILFQNNFINMKIPVAANAGDFSCKYILFFLQLDRYSVKSASWSVQDRLPLPLTTSFAVK